MAIMQNFKHPKLGEIRVLEIDGAPWFVGKDIAAALEYGDTDKALRNRVEEADKLTRPIDGSGQNRNMILVNERGMYSLAFSSRRSCARAFQDWMMNDIMPALRSKKENDSAPKNDVFDCENAETSAEIGEKVSLFSNPEFGEVRGIEIDGEPWLVGKDVASALGYQNPSNALYIHVDKEDKSFVMLDIADTKNRDVPVGQTKTAIINESGVYSLIFSSKLPGAKNFKRWVTSEVLPSIRKTGMYVSNPVASPYDVSALSPELQLVKSIFESMARTELEQKRQAAEQERIAQEQARQAEEQERMAQEQERQAEEQKRQAQEQEQHTEALKTVDQKLEDIRDVVVVRPETWRKDYRRLVSAIAQKRGGTPAAYRDTNAEIFKLLEDRAHVSLKRRLKNRRDRMAQEGEPKSKRDKLNQMDIIAGDKKLIEIYIAIVKEMCVQYEVSPSVLEEAQGA